MQVVTVGRLPDNTIQIDGDSQVSRHHVQLTNDNGQYYITDLNSTNGTYVNGNRISRTQKLQMRDVVRLGNTTIPWLMYFDANYVKQLYSQRKASNNTSPQSKPSHGGVAIYVDPRQESDDKNNNGNNGMAIAGFVFAFFFPLLGLIFSAIAISNANNRPDKKGKGLAVAGLVISIITLIPSIILLSFI